MAKLSDLQLASLLDEIASAMKVGMPILDAMQRLRDRRLGRVAKAGGKIADAMESGQSVGDAFRQSGSMIADEAAAVVQSCQAGSDPDLLTSMASVLRARDNHCRATRFAWLYPVILLVVAYLAGALVMAPLVLQNHGTLFDWPLGVIAVSRWLDSYWLVPLIVGGTLLVPLAGYFFKRMSLPRDVRRSLFCRSLIDQVKRDVPESDAIRSAAKIAGDQQILAAGELTLKSPAIDSLLQQAPQQLIALANAAPVQTIIAKLNFAAAFFEQRAKTRDYLWASLIPRAAMVLIGVGVSAAYIILFIAPVYQQAATW